MQRYLGKFVGVVLGFVFAGPSGAFIGLIVGHLHDMRMIGIPAARVRQRAAEGLHPGLTDTLQQSTFTIGIIVLGAKMAKADGRVSRQEIAAFRRVFQVPESQAASVGKLFDQARRTADGYEPYAARLAQVFRHAPQILEDIIVGLFLVAVADSPALSNAENNFLRRVAALFNFSEQDYMRLAAQAGIRLPEQNQPSPREDAYAVLGIPPTATDNDIKRTYRALIRKHHPDRLGGQGSSPDQVAQATERMKRINAAYAEICKLRGIK